MLELVATNLLGKQELIQVDVKERKKTSMFEARFFRSQNGAGMNAAFDDCFHDFKRSSGSELVARERDQDGFHF